MESTYLSSARSYGAAPAQESSNRPSQPPSKSGGSASKHRTPSKAPPTTGIDHALPVSTSSSPLNTIEHSHSLGNATLQQMGREDFDIDELFNDSPQSFHEDKLPYLQQGKQSDSIAETSNCVIGSGHYMSGAINNSSPTPVSGDDQSSPAHSVATMKNSGAIAACDFVQAQLDLKLATYHQYVPSPSESELQEQGFESHSQLPEEIQVESFNQVSLRKALRNISPRVSRKAQWYAWKKTTEMLEQTGQADWGETEKHTRSNSTSSSTTNESRGQRNWGLMEEEIEPLINPEQQSWKRDDLQMVEDTFEVNKEDNSDRGQHPLSLQLPGAQIVAPLLTGTKFKSDQRKRSGDSEDSVAMEISPEDRFTPQIIHCSRSILNHAKMQPTHAAVGLGFQSLAQYQQAAISRFENGGEPAVPQSWSPPCTIPSCYQKDHRAFQVRRAQLFCSSIETTLSTPSRQPDPLQHLQFCDDNSDPVTPPNHNIPRSSSPFSTPPHMTPTNHSPLKQLDTPSSFESAVRQSVERDTISQSFIRESTPAYDNRSPSPSPISRQDGLDGSSDLDTEMFDAPYEPSFFATREALLPPDNRQFGTMLPPPSRSKSAASSPQARDWSFDPASPSTLRSPAIARVINQSQTLRLQTQFPPPSPRQSHRSRPLPAQRGQGWVNESVSSWLVGHEYQTSINQDATDTIMYVLDKPSMFVNEEDVPVLLPPVPPIPDDELGPIRQVKRGAISKSVTHELGSKVRKTRAVTGSGKGRRCVTGGRKQRAVTAGLVKVLIAHNGGSVTDGGDGRTSNCTGSVEYGG